MSGTQPLNDAGSNHSHYSEYLDSIIQLVVPALLRNKESGTIKTDKYEIKLGRLYEGYPYHKYLFIIKDNLAKELQDWYEVWNFDVVPSFKRKVDLMPIETIKMILDQDPVLVSITESSINMDIHKRLLEVAERLK